MSCPVPSPDLTEAVAEISQASGRDIHYLPLSPEEFTAELVEHGWPTTDAEDYADAIAPIRRGMDSHISDAVQRALGRKARDFTDFARSAAAAGLATNLYSRQVRQHDECPRAEY